MTRSMLVCPRRRAKLRTAALMLAVWLFALVAGVANACVLHDRQGGRDGQVGSSAQALAHHEGSASTCKDARDASASTAVKPVGQDNTSPQWGAAAVQSRAGYLNPASDAATPLALDAGVLAQGLPAAIRFLRLRL